MNLLLFNLALDADDPILNFTTRWVNRLAQFYDRIDVITMRAGRVEVEPNVCVHSVGKEKGYGEARRAIEFYSILAQLLRERHYDACFAHMMPLFAVMGAPLLRLVHTPITLWYTHRSAHRILQLATAVSARVVTAAPDSFPLKTDKLRVIGHGIDTDFFTPIALMDESRPHHFDAPCIVQVARLMPIKRQADVIRALPDVPGAQAVFVGDVPPDVDPSYRDQLEALARDLGVTERVTFAGNQPPNIVHTWNLRASVAINLSPPGLFDKAVLEAMSCAVPTLVINPAFDPLLGEYANRLRIDSPDQLAPRLRDLLALSDLERRKIGMILRERVVAAHSLDGLIERLVRILNTGEPV